VSLLSRLLRRVFLGGEAETVWKWASQRAVSKRSADTCLCVQVSGGQLGKGIKCRNFTYLFIGSARWSYAVV
jgi:hypothetical protein